MRVGIVGLPNAGKSTLFNALTRAGAETAPYAFTTIDPNVAVAAVPDERLPTLGATLGSSELVPATIEFNDIAGLVRGASQGEGLGNRFLGAIRETDAICHVVRAHADANVPHPDGSIDPLRDIETIESELLLADLEQVERRLHRVTKKARSQDKEAIAEQGWLEEVQTALGASRPVRSVPPPEAAPDAGRMLSALTSIPVLIAVNVDEGEAEVSEAVAEHAERTGAGVIALSARLEAELSELDSAEGAEMRAGLGVDASSLERLVRAAYELLALITFFTAGADVEACARSLRRGSSAEEAAAVVHTDLRRDFVRAEVIDWRELVEAGGWNGAREKALVRTEGRGYVVQDGDVVNIKT
jgi:GTP-binding protein YchF